MRSRHDTPEWTVVDVGSSTHSQQFTGCGTCKFKILIFVCKGFVHKEKWVKGKLGSRRTWTNRIKRPVIAFEAGLLDTHHFCFRPCPSSKAADNTDIFSFQELLAGLLVICCCCFKIGGFI